MSISSGRLAFALACFTLASMRLTANPAPDRPATPRVALVLSGGSAFGMAHAGVIAVLEEAGIPIDMIMGTSMGAIVSGLYAAGYSPGELERIVTDMDWNSIFVDTKTTPADQYERAKRAGYAGRIGFGRGGLAIGAGLFSGQNVLSFFTELTLHSLVERDFDLLPVPWRAVAADIRTGEKIVFRNGSIAEAMRSSMSIPGVFRPYPTGGHTLIDGGIVDNMPVGIARDMGADIVIAVESRSPDPKEGHSLGDPLSIAGQTFNLFIQQNMRPSRRDADLLIVPDLTGYSIASYSEAAGIIERGVQAGRNALPALDAIVGRLARAGRLVRPERQSNRRAFRDPPRISALRVEGGGDEDRRLVESLFDPFVGSVPDRRAVRLAVDAVYSTGAYEFVVLDLEPLQDGSAAVVVRLVPASPPHNMVLLNYDFGGTVSASSTTFSALSAGVLFRGITNRDSALFVKAGMGSGVRAYAEFFQPVGKLYAMPWVRYGLEYDETTLDADEVRIGTLYRHWGGGLWLGSTLGPHSDMRIGAAVESVRDSSSVPPANRLLGTLRFRAVTDTRSATVFPDRGHALSAGLVLSAPSVLGSDFSFVQTEIDVEAAIPAIQGVTIGLAGFAGTDFAGLVAGAHPVDGSRYQTLPRQGMFYGTNPTSTRVSGSSVFGAGIEIRRRSGRLNAVLGGDLYLLANTSVGTAYRPGVPDDGFLPLRWTATIGAGARLSPDLGLLAGIGLVGTEADGSVHPALTILFGSFEDRMEDRR